MTVTLGSASVIVPQDGTPAALTVTISGPSGSGSVSVSALPGGMTAQFVAQNGGPSGTLTFTGSTSAEPGSFSPVVQVSLAGQSASASFTLVSAVVAKVSSTTDTTMGVNGVLKQFMSTSFQVAEWDGDYFGGSNAAALESTMTAMGPQHIRLQTVSQGVAMSTNTGTANDWDFTILDQTVQPILASADHSPEFQIATAPAWMCFSNGQLDVTNHVKDFAAYAANLVRYYNKGGFDWGGTHFQSPSNYPITWWGIFNEPNGNGITADQYVKIYNTVVPAMLAVDPTIKLSAVEYSDYGLGTGDGGDPMTYLPAFVSPANSGGVNTQVNIVSTHFYSSCNQSDPDASLMASVPQFASNVSYFYQELQTRPDLKDVPVWVTENNVNADYVGANGMSTCNPNQVFVDDHRGTSAFFAAWRPYVFSALGKVGNQALYHWAYDGDQQYGEVDPSGNTYLSYWVDQALDSIYPSTPGSPAPSILELSATDTTSVETLATKNADGSVTVMVDDHAVASPTDNNGSGAARMVIVDVSGMGNFSSASLLSISAGSSASTAPVPVSVTPASRMTISLPGYGVAWLQLKP
ncbi:MAG: cellulase family glycosylhydrolase [Terracidiphilus sp.]